MNKKVNHLFLRLHEAPKNKENALLDYVLPFDKSIKFTYYRNGIMDRAVYDFFENSDHLFLSGVCVNSLWFTFRYLINLQQQNKKENISLQEIFELSLLTDKDEKPDNDNFNKAFLNDSKRTEIDAHSDYYRCILFNQLEITDLELKRRIYDVLLNSVPSNFGSVVFDNDRNFKNPFVDLDKSNMNMAKPNEIVDLIKENNRERREIETELIENLGAPDDILFDGSRFTIFIPNSPVSVMFDVGEFITPKLAKYGHKERIDQVYDRTTVNYDIVDEYGKKIHVVHPCSIVPAYIDDKKSERCGAYWNGRTSWDYVWREYIENAIVELTTGVSTEQCLKNLKLISFILLLKNDGMVNGKLASEHLFEYKLKRTKISNKNLKVIDAQAELCSQLFDSTTKKAVSLIYEAHNGYIVVNHKPYNLSKSLKIDTTAHFYDKNYKQIGYSSSYSDFVFKKSSKTAKILANKPLKDIMVEQTYKMITRETRLLGVDYSSVNPQKQIQRYVEINKSDTSFLTNPWVYPIEFFRTKISTLFYDNSINQYIDKIQKEYKTKGEIKINNYDEVIDYIDNKKLNIGIVDSDDYIDKLFDFGGVEYKRNRNIASLVLEDGTMIETENYTFNERYDHIEFNDVDYE